ncbi:sugar-binding protein [Frankia sp. Cppng1_Ct_nod]|uniref:DivIVA domain-containing protein n=1 Tax=Frankia sp. Cppng1_Ct_nod TaxID=2897162 RepID=UPI001041626A|nr:sugar-binding protein [Frankia sp. Cppng1_Ct_nod]
MTEQTDLIPMSDGTDAAPDFDLVRRGYDPHQVKAHVNWLVEQLREAESHRAAAEAAASEAATEAASVRDDLAANRPAWEEFGGRITQILQLAEEEAAVVRAERTREAEVALEEARQVHADAARTRERTVRDAEKKAKEIISAAQAEAEHIVSDAHTTAEVAEDESQRRLADLGRQRDQVTAQLGQLRDRLAAAMAPLDLGSDPTPVLPGNEQPATVRS